MIKDHSLGSKIFDAIVVILLVVVTLLCLLPLWYIFCVSLSSNTAISMGKVSFWPVDFTLISYQKILGESAFFNSFWVSVKRVVLGTLLTLFCVLPAGYALSRTDRQFPQRNIFMWTLIFCMLFNGGTVPWYLTMRKYGLIDNLWGLVLGGGLAVFNVTLIMNFFRNLPGELEEAAWIDGAGPWQVLITIFIPLAKPSIATITLFTMVSYWNEFFQGLVLSTREVNYPLQTYIQQLVVSPENYSNLTAEQIESLSALNNDALDAAKIFTAMIPVLIVYPFLQKYFVKGITLGSVKG